MTTTTPNTPHRVGDRVQLRCKGQLVTGRISAIHSRDDGTEFVVRAEDSDGGLRGVLNIWSTSSRPSFFLPLAAAARS